MATYRYELKPVRLDSLPTQTDRWPVDDEKVAEYRQRLTSGEVPPPLIVCGESIFDGVNRIVAARELAIGELPAAVCPTAKDAVKLRRALGPNVVNGWQRLHPATP